jgi:hypothetical protein
MTDLRGQFRTRSRRQFSCQAAIADVMSITAQRMQMQTGEVLEALICNLVSVVQARAMPEEWADVGATVTEEIRRRLTVVQN